ncbi:hypothetical protein Ddc_23025 [Ditylenchus destructor]|nr:hypothetical protein Ddc_23025 [Ditylenchus destructor]
MTAFWVCGYRVGQIITLLIAIDRLVAISKPIYYSQQQSHINKTVTVFGCIILAVFALLLCAFMIGADSSRTQLATCTSTSGPMYFTIIPPSSAVVCVAFFVAYLSSLLLFTRHIAKFKVHEAQSQAHQTTIQLRLFSTISIALIFYTIFYVVPTILQLLNYYFGFNYLANIANNAILYGVQFDAVLNVLIYLIRHHEFNKCSKQFICVVMGKGHALSHTNDSGQKLSSTKVVVVRLQK